METISVRASSREIKNEKKKSNLKKIRVDGLVPGVLYGCGECTHFVVPAMALRGIVYSSKKYIIDLDLDGVKHECIVKEIQFHPVSDMILHIDLLKVDGKKKVEVDVNIYSEGIAAGSRSGGTVKQKMRKIKLVGFPKDIPSEVVIDITKMNLGEAFRVGDLEMGNGCCVGKKVNPRDQIFVVER